MRTARSLVTVAILLAVAAPAQAAAGWSPTRTLFEGQYAYQPGIGFSANGQAAVAGYTSDQGLYVARHDPRRGFRSPSFYGNLPQPEFQPILDPNGAGVLFGTYFDNAPEEAGIRDSCCDRVAAARLVGERIGRLTKLSPHARALFYPGARALTDGRGSAAALWLTRDGWTFSLRRRGGAFGTPTGMDPPVDFSNTYGGDIVMRPSGWAFAAWVTEDRREIRFTQRPRSEDFAPDRAVFRVEPTSSLRISSARFEVGERGHIWLLWDLEPEGYAPGKVRTVAMPRRADGSFGRAQTIARSTSYFDSDAAVDHRGDLHFIWQSFERGLNVRTVERSGRLGNAVGLNRTGGSVAIAAGARGRAVAAWRVPRGAVFAIDRVPGERFRGIRALDPGKESGDPKPVVAVGPRRESIVLWTRTLETARTLVRYAVLGR